MITFNPALNYIVTLRNCLIAAALYTGPLLASDNGQHAGSVAAHQDKHFVGFFIGELNSDDSEDTVIGIEYEYKFNASWGVGAVYEEASGAHHGDGVNSKIAALYFHPAGGLRFGIGVGEEEVEGSHGHDETLYRVGVSYEFHIADGIGIEPSFNRDFVDSEHADVYGVALVFSF